MKQYNYLLLLRLATGFVFISEGLQKFIKPNEIGVGRFQKLGILYPDIMAVVVGNTEILCGLLIVLGFYIRYAVWPVISIIIAAIIITKIPIFLEHDFWKMAHESRTDFLLLLSLAYLSQSGSGKYSIDHKISLGYYHLNKLKKI